MKRKVIKHGPSTFIVSLPIKWVKKQGIEKGDEIEIKESGNTIIISPEKIKTNSELTADVSGLIPRLADRFLARAYQKGYDKIRLIHDDIELLKTVQTKIHELIGYEIIEQDDKYCTIKAISSHIELDFDTSLRRAFLLVKQMSETCHKAYKNKESKTLANLQLKDIEVNRLCYFCLRQINKRQHTTPENAQHAHILYYLIEILEDMGDSYKKLARLLSKSKKVNQDILNLIDSINKQFELSYSYFYEPEKEKANKAFNLFKKIEKDCNTVVENKPSADDINCIHLIKDIAHITYHYTTMRLDNLKK